MVLEKAPGALCDQCPLKDEPFVPGDGPDRADICVVGEAPGANEVKRHKPFIGISGQLLDKILVQNNIERSKVYVTNACLCRPPDNANPPTSAIKACRPRLIRELQEHKPQTVLALGAIAAKSILATTTGITELRAAPRYHSEELDARVIPTFHPAGALRNPDWLPSIILDVGKINRVEVGWEPTRYEVVRSVEEGIGVLAKQVATSPLLALDIETHYEKGAPNDPHHTDLLCIAISHRPGVAIVYPQEVARHPRWLECLDRSFTQTKWLMQSGKFDIQRLWSVGVKNARLDEDTLLAHAATDERKGIHDLETMATELLGAPAYKTDTRQFLPHKGASLRYLPKAVLHEYNATDVDVTYRLHERLKTDLKGDDVEGVYRSILIPGSNAVATVEYAGIRVDRTILEALSEMFEASLEAREAELTRWVANPRSPIQVKHAIEELGYSVPDTREDTIKNIGEAFTEKILDYRGEHKLLTTYVRGLARRLVGDRIYSSFNFHVAETGRLSSTNPNLQNIPHDSAIRNAFIADEGSVLLAADYAAIEARYICHLINDPYMTRAFNEGRNLNVERAERIWGHDYTEKEYVWGKNCFYGSFYMSGATNLATRYNLPLVVAQQIQGDMFRNSPGIKSVFWASKRKELIEKNYLTSHFGRKRRFWLITPSNFKDLLKEAVNFDPQGTCSDFNLIAGTRLVPMLEGKATLNILIHDALIFNVRKEHLKEVAQTIKREMEAVPQLSVPTPVELKIGEQWGRMKTYNESGN